MIPELPAPETLIVSNNINNVINYDNNIYDSLLLQNPF